MKASLTRNYSFSDPGEFNPVIRKKKEYAQKHTNDPDAWLELGRLYEARIELTNKIINKTFFGRHFLFFLIFGFGVGLSGMIHAWICVESGPWAITVFRGGGLLLVVVLLTWIYCIRYPRSGRRFFKKAIKTNPQCGEAYLFLGLIALRRRRREKARRLWEKALMRGVKNEDIEKELSFFYEEEFFQYFEKETLKKNKKDQIIKDQEWKIKELQARNNSLKRRIEALSSKIKQTKWEANHHIKSYEKEASDRFENIQQDYEAQISKLRKEKQLQKEAREDAERNRMRLNTEILEAKASLEVSSFEVAAKKAKASIGEVNWNALSKESRSYLATAEQVASMLNIEEHNVDYGLVGMELCKALEKELNRFLIEPFVEQLNGDRNEFLRINTMGEKSGKPVYFSYLAKLVDRENFPGQTTLTLGQCHFVLNKALNGEYALKLYRDFLDNNSTQTVIGQGFVKKLGIVVNKYRNTIAHQSKINKKEYMALRKLIFAGKQSLLKTVLDCHLSSSLKEKPYLTEVMTSDEHFQNILIEYSNGNMEAAYR